MASKTTNKKSTSTTKKDNDEKMATIIAGIACIIVIIVTIVISIVPGKAGPMGQTGLMGGTGDQGKGNTEMGPMGDTGMTGTTGTQGIIGYNKWQVARLQGGSTTIPYPGLTRYVNYYWAVSPNPDDLSVYIDATQLKPGDIFTITNLTSKSYLYIKPSGFQNGHDETTKYYLHNTDDTPSESTVKDGFPNTALIIITHGATNTSTPDPDAKLINIIYSTIQTDFIT